MNAEFINDLQAWFRARCDGTWEHHHGITLETVDNPGWMATISLIGTPWEKVPFTPIEMGRRPGNLYEESWLHCFVENGIFRGASNDLLKVLAVFKNWIASTT